jgi:predicted AAA+ superfamily ATPase
LNTAGKVYAVDTGIRNSFNNFVISNRGNLLENIVYVELLRRKFGELYVEKLPNNKEIDFIAVKGGIKTYIQVCENISSREIEKREIGNLANIKNSFPKQVLVLNGDSQILDNGIEIINLIDWLLS